MAFPKLLLVAETRLSDFSAEFRDNVVVEDGSQFWIFLIVAIAALIGGTLYWISIRPPAIVNTPMGLMFELCRSHRVSARGHRLLCQIAEAAELDNPAIMFVGRDQFESAVERAGKKIRYARSQERTLGMLRRRLF